MVMLWFSLYDLQVMETKDMLYMVTEYAQNGEMFGKFNILFILEFLVALFFVFY